MRTAAPWRYAILDAVPATVPRADGATVPPTPPPGSLHPALERFRPGIRTLVMGILNITPDSFSGDGLAGGVGVVIAQAAGRDIYAGEIGRAHV